LQEYEHQRELQAENSRLAQLEYQADSVQHADLQPGVLKPTQKKKRRLQTSQKRILKVDLLSKRCFKYRPCKLPSILIKPTKTYWCEPAVHAVSKQLAGQR